MHPYFSSLHINQTGVLDDAQHLALAHIIRWRMLSAYIMILGFGLLALFTTIPLLTGDLDIPVFWILDGLYLAGFLWGFILLVEQHKNIIRLAHEPVRVLAGAPHKINRAVAATLPADAGGMMLLKHLKAGVVKLDGKTYGSLPGLYDAIEDGSPAECYIVDLRFGGIDGVIVNYF